MIPQPTGEAENIDAGTEPTVEDFQEASDNHSGDKKYSEAYLISTLQQLQKDLGRAPTVGDVRNLSEKLPDVSTYERRFGSWIEALEAASIEGAHNRSNETILGQLALFASQLGRAPTKREVDENPRVASSGLYTSRFGKFSEAVYLAQQYK